ncbi:MAG: hypothetical protein ACK5XN_17020 [Bacteroidota bacterium]|jgi:hypothetical protein
MYIAHYKSVNSSKEFYAQKREKLDFPTQVQMNNERYMLHSTYIAAAKTMQERIESRAKELGIPFNVEIK